MILAGSVQIDKFRLLMSDVNVPDSLCCLRLRDKSLKSIENIVKYNVRMS